MAKTQASPALPLRAQPAADAAAGGAVRAAAAAGAAGPAAAAPGAAAGAAAAARPTGELACTDPSMAMLWQTVPEIVNVRLTLKGKAKLVRHAASTRISELLTQHQASLGQPLVAKDSRGYEMGGEVRLGQLVAQPGGCEVLELFLEVDAW